MAAAGDNDQLMDDVTQKISQALGQLLQALNEQWQRLYTKLGPRGTGVALLALLFVIVVLQNLDNVEIDILFWEIQVPKLFFFIGLTAFGFAVGYLAGSLKKPN